MVFNKSNFLTALLQNNSDLRLVSKLSTSVWKYLFFRGDLTPQKFRNSFKFYISHCFTFSAHIWREDRFWQNASLFGLTYRFLLYFAVFSANTKDELRLPSEMMKTHGDTAADQLQWQLSRESYPNGDEIDPQQTRFCYRVGWWNLVNLLRTDIFTRAACCLDDYHSNVRG